MTELSSRLFTSGLLVAALVLWGTACSAGDRPVTVSIIADFREPWAMTFLPDGRLLVTEKAGSLKLMERDGAISEIRGLPEVAYGGQGGLGDIVPHPRFAENRLLYFSYAERGAGGLGAAVARARLVAGPDGDALQGVEVIWRQQPKVGGRGHYGHRLAFGPEGYLWISSGDRQKFDPAQDMAGNLGKTLRLRDDGTVPPDNPFARQGGIAAQIWSLGHRNPLGIAFDPAGRLWLVEMGPAGGG